jgi:hypothetical protein
VPLTEEEQKALAHLESEKKRDEFQRFLQSKLKPASELPAAQTKKNWAPVTARGRIKGQVD